MDKVRSVALRSAVGNTLALQCDLSSGVARGVASNWRGRIAEGRVIVLNDIVTSAYSFAIVIAT